ncbi:MAG TPA: hypothetical protein VKR31_02765 [Rhizomicrobium sp.]|nr:hypothetical protein [Rhizomicrobium sp.]
MKIKHWANQAAAATTAFAMLASGTAALAKRTCFTSFSGTVNTQFDGAASTLQSLGYHPLTGVTFGALFKPAPAFHTGVLSEAPTPSREASSWAIARKLRMPAIAAPSISP